MELNKFELKVLKYINRRHSGTSQEHLLRKYKKHNISNVLDHLLNDEYIEVDRVPYLGESYAEVPTPDKIKLTISSKGTLEIESHQWFDGKYIVSALVVPIVVGVVSSLITALFLALFA